MCLYFRTTMSGGPNDELKKMVQLYIDDESEAGERLKKENSLTSK